MLPAAEQMGRQWDDIRQRSEDSETPHERIERRARADVHAPDSGTRYANDDRRPERVAERRIYMRDPPREGDAIVARHCPEGAAGGDDGAGDADHHIEDEDYEEGGGRGLAVCRLEVDRLEGEGECGGLVEDGVEVVDAVEEGNVEEEDGEEAADQLCGYAVGDVLLRVGDFLGH